jgi:hypothetical protein
MKIPHFRYVARAFLRLAMAGAALLCTVAAAQSRSDGMRTRSSFHARLEKP